MKNYIKHLALVLLTISLVSCSKDNEDQGSNAAVDQITLNIQHIATPTQEQPDAKYVKFNMLGEKIYFQELTGNPWTGNARLWKYNTISNQYTLLDARGDSFSWAGWGTKLFNLNGLMFHIEPYSSPYIEYLSGNDWIAVQTNVPDQIVTSDVAVSGDKVYFLGGEDLSTNFTSYRLPNEWFNMTAFPIPIEKSVLTADENYVYSLGGYESENGGNYFTRFSIENNQWERLPDIPNKVFGSNFGNRALIIKNRFLFVISSNGSSSLLDVYDLQENVWKSTALSLNLPTPYFYEYNDRLYIISTTYNQNTDLLSINLYKADLEYINN